MKKIFTLVALSLFIFTASFSQIISNPSFETWTTYTGAVSGSYPTGWATTDSIYQIGGAGHSAVQNGVDHCNGNFSIKLTTVSALGQIGPGVATNGIANGYLISQITGGDSSTTRYGTLNCCYAWAPVSGDTAYISAYMLKRNGATRDTIAAAIFMIKTAVASLTSFSTNFVYRDLVRTPDTMLIILQSSPNFNRGQIGSILKVDNLTLTGHVGINEVNSPLKSVQIFPSPAHETITIRAELNKEVALSYEIMDLSGRIVMHDKMKATTEELNISGLSNGNYFVNLLDENGEKLYSGKFNVLH